MQGLQVEDSLRCHVTLKRSLEADLEAAEVKKGKKRKKKDIADLRDRTREPELKRRALIISMSYELARQTYYYMTGNSV